MCLFEIKLQVENKSYSCWSASIHYMPINKKHIALWVGDGVKAFKREREMFLFDI